MKTLIEKSDWLYYVYEVNGDLELSIPIGSPPPGFDILHTLTVDEKKIYEKAGISSLQERIKHMKENRNEYKLIAWK